MSGLRWGSWILALCLLVGLEGCDRSATHLERLKNGTPPERVAAAEWFAEHPKQEAVPYLVRGLDAEEFEVRWACARAIAAAGDPGAVAAAVEAMGRDALSPDPKQAERAIETLGALGGAALPELVLVATVTPDRRLQTAIRLQIAAVAPQADARLRERAARLLVSALEETDPQMYRLAYDLLLFGLLHLREEILRVGLSSADRTVLRSVVLAVGELGDPNAAPALLPLLDDPDSETRRYVVEALGRSKNPIALSRLEQIAKNDIDLRVRRAAEFAIAQIRQAQADQKARE